MKAQITQIQNVLEKQIARAEVEGFRILSGVVGEKVNKKASLSEIYQKIKANNPSVKRLILNIDTATYDTRKTLEWNVTMLAAYAKLQAEKKVESDVVPAVKHYAEQIESKASLLSDKAKELSNKLQKH